MTAKPADSAMPESAEVPQNADDAMVPSAASGVDVVTRLAAGLEAQKMGDRAAAEAAYREVLAVDPNRADALHLLGTLHIEFGDFEGAVEHIEAAIAQAGPTAQFLTNLGAALHHLNRVDEAETRYRGALELNPTNLDAHSNLGHLLLARDQTDEAIEHYEAACRINPDAAQLHKILGQLYFRHGQFDSAAECYSKYLELAPEAADARNKLGCAYLELERFEDAEAAFRSAYEADPASLDILRNLTRALGQLGRGDEIEGFLRAAAERDPSQARHFTNLGGHYASQGRLLDALEMFRRAYAAAPDEASVILDLGQCLCSLRQFQEAIEIMSAAVKTHPDDPEMWNVLGAAYTPIRRDKEAEDAFTRVLELDPNNFHAANNLCGMLAQAKKLDDAYMRAQMVFRHERFEPKTFTNVYLAFRLTCDFESLKELGDLWELCEAVPPLQLTVPIFNMLVDSETPDEVRRLVKLHRRWGEAVEAEAAKAQLPERPVAERPKERLRIGFLSSDLRSHSVAKHVLPLFEHASSSSFEIFGYSPWADLGDPVQHRIMESLREYRVIADMTARDIAALIRADEIDILVDLNGHTSSHRLDTFAYRAAPVQICWLGYPFTTGLDAIDYYVVDEYLKPSDDDFLVERPLVMPGAWTAFANYDPEPIFDDLPLDRNGMITFGTLNAPYKFTPRMIGAWAEILKAVPGSRFLFVHDTVKSMILNVNIANEFGKHGVESERLLFMDNRAQGFPHLMCYNEIDITLDTFPLTGGTTTGDALWMGVPVVTLVGDSIHQRTSYAILKHAGLDELCTFDLEAYVEKAVGLANDVESLNFLRRHLRSGLEQSHLCNGELFADQFCQTMVGVAKRHGLIQA